MEEWNSSWTLNYQTDDPLFVKLDVFTRQFVFSFILLILWCESVLQTAYTTSKNE